MPAPSFRSIPSRRVHPPQANLNDPKRRVERENVARSASLQSEKRRQSRPKGVDAQKVIHPDRELSRLNNPLLLGVPKRHLGHLHDEVDALALPSSEPDLVEGDELLDSGDDTGEEPGQAGGQPKER